MRFLRELQKAIATGQPDSDVVKYHNEIINRAAEGIRGGSRIRTSSPLNVELLFKRMSEQPKAKRSIKQRWDAFKHIMDKKFDKFLMSIYFKIPKWKKKIDRNLTDLSFKIHRHVYKEEYANMFKIIERMDNIQTGDYSRNAKSRQYVNNEERDVKKALMSKQVEYAQTVERSDSTKLDDVFQTEANIMIEMAECRKITPNENEKFSDLLTKLKSIRKGG